MGRSEVLRPRLERHWLAASHKTGDEANPWNYLVRADRFGLANKERVETLDKLAMANGAR